MAGPGNILIRVGAETAGAVKDLNNVNRSLGETMTTGQKATAGLKKAALPAAAALGAISVAAFDATKAAIADAAAQDKLAGQLERVTGATDKQLKAADDYITALSMQVGIADDELRPALGKLATATGDLSKAQGALALATDISAQTGKSLDTVTTALAKGYGGNTAAIGKLVPGMDKAVLASKDMHAITGELARLTGGAATDAAETNAGQMRVMSIQMEETKEEIGKGLIPVFEALLPMLKGAATFASENTDAIKVLVGIIAALSGAILIANAALKAYQALQVAVKVATAAWTAVQWLLNAALNANPIGLAVIALAALAAGLVLAYQKSETFRNIVHAAMDVVTDAVKALDKAFDAARKAAFDAWNWITDHWKIALFAFGPIGAAVYLISENFDRIKSMAVAAFNAIESGIKLVLEPLKKLLELLKKVKLPKIKLPDLPGPLMMPGGVHGAAGRSGARAAGGVATSAAGGITVNVYGAIDPEGTARTIMRVLTAHERRQGRRV